MPQHAIHYRHITLLWSQASGEVKAFMKPLAKICLA